MSKSINKTQSEILLNKMMANKEVAAGFFKGAKDQQEAVWSETAEELNSAGPPTKSVSEWKRVWNDQKRYVRKKLAFNMQQSKCTGGGPNLCHKLSASEETIAAITGMTDSVQGLEGVISCGFEPLPTILDEVTQENDSTNETPPQTTKTIRKEVPSCSKRKTTSTILEEEVEVQKEIVKRMKGIEDNTRALNKRFGKFIKFKEEELKEIKKQTLESKRHNMEMENLRKREIEIKLEKTKRIIEIEELKLSTKEA